MLDTKSDVVDKPFDQQGRVQITHHRAERDIELPSIQLMQTAHLNVSKEHSSNLGTGVEFREVEHNFPDAFREIASYFFWDHTGGRFNVVGVLSNSHRDSGNANKFIGS